MKNIKKIQFKRFIREYEFLQEDLQDLKEIQSVINTEFNQAFSSMKDAIDQDDFRLAKLAKKAQKDAEDLLDEEEEDRDPMFKNLFRKIVVKCHPDRVTGSTEYVSQFREMYEDAIQANEDYDWAALIILAGKLEIELGEDYAEKVDEIEKSAKKLQEEMDRIKGSIAWQWYHADEGLKEPMLVAYRDHLLKMMMDVPTRKKILGLGHPRSGTGYTAAILSSWGLQVGHEIMQEDGIVAWPLAAETDNYIYLRDYEGSYEYDTTIYCVRDPRQTIASIVYTEDERKESLSFRANHGKFEIKSNRVENAIASILAWDRLCSVKADFVFRVEDQARDLFEFLKPKYENLEWNESVVNTPQNTRNHDSWESLLEESKTVNLLLKKGINRYCRKYGYEKMF
jgi:hypothetical protein